MAEQEQFPDKIKKNIDRVLDLIKSDKLPEVVAKIVFPKTGKPMSAWSISNTMLCITDWIYTHYEKEMSKAETPEERGIIFMRALPEALEKADYRGFKQWQEAKRNVKKGQISTGYILAPMFRKAFVKYVYKDGQKIRVYKSDEKKYKPEELKSETFRFIFGFRGVPTFDILQTEGKAVKYKELKLPQLPFKPVADFLGIKVIPKGFTGREYGSFSPQAKLITLATPDEGTFLHELSHAVDDYIMKETTGKGLKGGQQIDQELVAEFSSAVLLSVLGKELDQKASYTRRYVQGYTGKETGFEEDLIQLMARIEKIIDFITNFKQAESPNRQAEKKEGEPADEVEKLANNPPKPTKAEETKRVSEAEDSIDEVKPNDE